MGDVVNLTFGRAHKGKKLPKPVLCKECEEPIETARVQALTGDYCLKPDCMGTGHQHCCDGICEQPSVCLDELMPDDVKAPATNPFWVGEFS